MNSSQLSKETLMRLVFKCALLEMIQKIQTRKPLRSFIVMLFSVSVLNDECRGQRGVFHWNWNGIFERFFPLPFHFLLRFKIRSVQEVLYFSEAVCLQNVVEKVPPQAVTHT